MDAQNKPKDKPVDWFNTYIKKPYEEMMGPSVPSQNSTIGEGLTKSMDKRKARDFSKGFNGG